MQSQATNQGKNIGNVGLLDLRDATESALAEINRVGNIGMVLYSAETAHLLPKLNTGNLGATVEAPADSKLLTGRETFSRDTFKNQAEPLNVMISGQLIINPDLSEAELSQGLGELVVTGQIICPQHLAGVIQAKMRHLSGNMRIYDEQARLVMGSLTLDEHYLHSLDDGAVLMVLGKVKLPHILPNELLSQKIKKLQAKRQVVCHEENVSTLMSLLDDKAGAPKVTVVPTGFTWIERALVLDNDLLESLPSNRLYCTEKIEFGANVTSEVLDSALEKLIVTETLIAPVGLRRSLAQKCNLLETQAIFYEGELWSVDTELLLAASRFDYLEGKATLMVTGELTIAADIEPQTLAARLDKVHNFGEIICTADQMGAIQARLGINTGELIDSNPSEESGTDGIGNVGYLKL